MLLGVDVAGILNDVLGRDAAPATLTKTTAGTRTPGNVSAGTNPTSVDYPASGWIEAFETTEADGTLIQENDRKISLLARSVGAVPSPNDKITMADLDGASKTFTIVGPVDASGPQGAVWICRGRV